MRRVFIARLVSKSDLRGQFRRLRANLTTERALSENAPLTSWTSRIPPVLIAACLSLATVAFGDASVEAPVRRVVVVYANGRPLPANALADHGLRASLDASRTAVEIFSEFLDVPRFQGAHYQRTMTSYLKDKYEALPPDVLVAGGDDAFLFLMRTRADAFPGVPMVYLSVSREEVEASKPLPEDVYGVPLWNDPADTIDAALRWQPSTKRIVAVTGTAPWDLEWEASLRESLARFGARAATEQWTGLPLRELETRLAGLGPGTIVFSPGFFGDGTGRIFTPAESIELIARASDAPVYGPYDTFIGTGVVGGRMPSFEEMGYQAGEIVGALLAGASAASLELPPLAPTRLHLDWRQAERFGIRAADVSPDTIVHFRPPSVWESHRELILATAAVIALQAALILALLAERRRRHATERRVALATTAAGLSMWEWDPRDAANEPFDRVHPADRDSLERALRHALDKDVPVNLEYRTVEAGGELRWLAAYGRPESGSAPRVLGVARDVTARKLAELQAEQDRNALRHVGRVAMLGQLAAAIAHQLNQPLAAILANAEAARMLLRRESLGPTDLHELRAICDDVVSDDHRAADVIRRLRALFRRDEVRPALVDLNELVVETLDLARTDLLMRRVTAATALDPELPPVRGDRVQLQQVVLNLITNAADAMEKMEEPARELSIRTARDEAGVLLSVADRGPGIPPEDLARAFDPFWTTKPEGMGVGLSICRSIVDAHGGRMTAANRPGGGAELSVVLPSGATP